MTTLYTICTEYSEQAKGKKVVLKGYLRTLSMTSFYTICTEYSNQTMARWCLREEWECPFSELSAGVSVLGMTRKKE